MRNERSSIVERLTDKLDLIVDFATLGEYGLESEPASDAGCEGSGQTTGWEALAPARRGRCTPATVPGGRTRRPLVGAAS